MTARPDELLSLRGRVAIVGVADAASPDGELADHGLALEMRIVAEALADAGIHPREVDGLAVAGGPMSAKGDRKRYGAMRGDVSAYGAEHLEFEAPSGIALPLGAYAHAAQRHMSVYGTTAEHLAQIAVSTRGHGTHNPRARQQQPLTIDEVLATPTICGPLRGPDCCLITDGAGAIVMTRADRALDLRPDAAYVLGAASAQTHLLVSGMPDLTVTPGVMSGPEAFAQAGIGVDDVDVLQTYDSFTITVLLALEDLGFCNKGEGGEFVAERGIGAGGSLPTNTPGGGLSYTHPGMFGIFLLVEAARQLRGTSSGIAIPDVKIAVAHGCGGLLSSTGTVVLGAQETL